MDSLPGLEDEKLSSFLIDRAVRRFGAIPEAGYLFGSIGNGDHDDSSNVDLVALINRDDLSHEIEMTALESRSVKIDYYSAYIFKGFHRLQITERSEMLFSTILSARILFERMNIVSNEIPKIRSAMMDHAEKTGSIRLFADLVKHRRIISKYRKRENIPLCLHYAYESVSLIGKYLVQSEGKPFLKNWLDALPENDRTALTGILLEPDPVLAISLTLETIDRFLGALQPSVMKWLKKSPEQLLHGVSLWQLSRLDASIDPYRLEFILGYLAKEGAIRKESPEGEIHYFGDARAW